MKRYLKREYFCFAKLDFFFPFHFKEKDSNCVTVLKLFFVSCVFIDFLGIDTTLCWANSSDSRHFSLQYHVAFYFQHFLNGDTKLAREQACHIWIPPGEFRIGHPQKLHRYSWWAVEAFSRAGIKTCGVAEHPTLKGLPHIVREIEYSFQTYSPTRYVPLHPQSRDVSLTASVVCPDSMQLELSVCLYHAHHKQWRMAYILFPEQLGVTASCLPSKRMTRRQSSGGSLHTAHHHTVDVICAGIPRAGATLERCRLQLLRSTEHHLADLSRVL